MRNKIMRQLWQICYLLFFRFSPRPFHAWRRWILILFGAKIGKHTHVYPSVKIWAPWNLIIGNECGIGNGTNLYAQDKIFIGNYAVVSQGAHLCAGTHDYTKSGFPLLTKPIIIGDYVWIASEAFIHPGITMGAGAVVGARSVVISNLPAWQVCSGFPCKPIKPRVNPYAGH
jgi:putative colanic acid biosynthesis acetyltransferase WcaF